MTQDTVAVVPDSKRISMLRNNIEKVVFGKTDLIDLCIAGLLARGHILIEDVPGIGKTLLAAALAKSIACKFSRIQFTSDLLPSDIVGVSVLDGRGQQFEFRKGPIFANVVLADEINRTTPKTQSALLEAMQDHQVSMDNDTYLLPKPFIVLATQNPVEYEGTYPLPESELDRFMLRLKVGYPAREDEMRVLRNGIGPHSVELLEPVLTADDILDLHEQAQAVTIDDALVDYLMDIIAATRAHPDIELGVSPRGALAFYEVAQAYAFVQGRRHVLPDDVKTLAVPVLSHRIVLRSHRGAITGVSEESERIIKEMLASIAVPV
jgi:MoxR-like ATPase